MINLVCEQALHLGESREVMREQQAKGDASARGGPRGFVAREFARHKRRACKQAMMNQYLLTAKMKANCLISDYLVLTK